MPSIVLDAGVTVAQETAAVVPANMYLTMESGGCLNKIIAQISVL